MPDTRSLTALQVHVATVFFSLDASRGFLVAGGSALIASNLIDRTTDDLDLFAGAPVTSVRDAREALVEALQAEGHRVDVLRDAQTFCRMVVRDDADEVLVDLAIDSPPISVPTLTVLGPTLAPDELATRKLLALFGRAEARDFADVYLLAQRFNRDEMMRMAASMDLGFNEEVLGQMLSTMVRFSDDEIPLQSSQVPEARTYFHEWASELRRQLGTGPADAE